MDDRRKRMKFRFNHMGMAENDVLFGSFANAHLETLSDELVDQLEALLDVNDNDLFNWAAGREPVPEKYDNEIFNLIQNFKLSL
ncbi:MAG: succinate dehydrogenase assembly factor 2 [Rhodospirillaceae bacterium]|jgi:antitoxin CptB|nr:succinate dehydrogenase assembly factor 2 [Rhodospirillales bacterium]MBT3904032.1 succinate dehydrogenase assembly factor 2 [Rhodospirillaceae bacterium]MBT4702947.1 succinate dehydrogenase assembly factor 2 [Rhodospirillaceae bacterium]MBT5036507.1 succinate dehydrogenase assembly factor 2 [Rhodospirillaceae bacterium]MBT6218232.1 succinate dehydrogenase assembly factor 2 [Rhodospirillaceae bacterium]